ncbi:MAG: SHOCT domain-containing protein [Hydrogenovibrio sp.]|nr:SHOCT domain-containing protein [Hydrogenovibrio sp.]
MTNGYGYSMWHAMGAGMWLFWVFFLIVVFVLYKVVTSKAERHESERESPLDILEKRYARGEISKEEFEERKQTLLE